MEKIIDVETLYANELSDIWKKHSDVDEELISRNFLAPKYVYEDSILFLGINPSFDEKKTLGTNFYQINEENPDHPYFQKFKELTVKAEGVKWSHLDLLFFRETNQKAVDKFIYNNPKGLQFIYDQIMISKQLLEISKPKIIVASNTKVRQLMGYKKDVQKNIDIWMGYDFKFDNEIGTYKIETNGALFNTPVFFTSMLSGQRALDIGSFRRLEWHIKFVLDKIS